MMKRHSNFRIASFDVEVFLNTKATLLSNSEANIMRILETHWLNTQPSIPTTNLIISQGSAIRGSVVFPKDKSVILRSKILSQADLEWLLVQWFPSFIDPWPKF